MGAVAELDISDLEAYAKYLEPKGFKERLDRNMKRATLNNAVYFSGKVDENIRDGNWEANSGLTKILKNSSLPLIDNADLVNSLTVEPARPAMAVFVGLHRANERGISIVKALHDGVTFNVTDRMRAFFRWMASQFPEVKPLKASTTHITIPARPFFREVLENPKIQQRMAKIWAEAAVAAYEGMNWLGVGRTRPDPKINPKKPKKTKKGKV